MCKGWFPDKNTSVDHVHPVGALSSFEDLPGFVERLFCSVEGLQVLCDECHAVKTAEERVERKAKGLQPVQANED